MPNPYRQPKPSRRQVIARGKFYLAGPSGRRTSSYGQVLLLTPEFVWIDSALSIPIAAIVDCGVSKRHGYIAYRDEIAGEAMVFNFTFPGFFRPRLDKISAFVNEIQQARRNVPFLQRNKPVLDGCERCQSANANFYVFRVFRFVGIAPIAYAYRLTPGRYLLCDSHARGQVLRCNLETGFLGSLGFPGMLAAPWYITRNLIEYGRSRPGDLAVIAASTLLAIGIPLGLWTLFAWSVFKATANS